MEQATATATIQEPRTVSAPARTIYEQPLNERMRLFLRLDFLFQQALHHLRKDDLWENRASLSALLSLLDLLQRIDLKADLVKELERMGAVLERLAQIPDVDTEQLDQVLEEIEHTQDNLQRLEGSVDRLLQHPLLSCVSKRYVIPGGTCHFDLPLLHHWLHQPSERRIQDLENWFNALRPFQEGTALTLRLIRESAAPIREIAERGMYQKSLDSSLPWQMVRIALPAEAPYYPEISAGKHRFTVRFLQPVEMGRPAQVEEDIPFMLSCCAL